MDSGMTSCCSIFVQIIPSVGIIHQVLWSKAPVGSFFPPKKQINSLKQNKITSQPFHWTVKEQTVCAKFIYTKNAPNHTRHTAWNACMRIFVIHILTALINPSFQNICGQYETRVFFLSGKTKIKMNFKVREHHCFLQKKHQFSHIVWLNEWMTCFFFLNVFVNNQFPQVFCTTVLLC